MLDIYNRQQKSVGGVFTVDKGVVAISGGGASWVGAIVQRVQWNYPQPIRFIYEIGSNNVYRAVGRSVGQMTIDRIVGVQNSTSIDKAMFDACNVDLTMTLNVQASGCAGINAGQVLVFDGLVVTNTGGAIQVEDQLIYENLSLMFTGFNRS